MKHLEDTDLLSKITTEWDHSEELLVKAESELSVLRRKVETLTAAERSDLERIPTIQGCFPNLKGWSRRPQKGEIIKEPTIERFTHPETVWMGITIDCLPCIFRVVIKELTLSASLLLPSSRGCNLCLTSEINTQASSKSLQYLVMGSKDKNGAFISA